MMDVLIALLAFVLVEAAIVGLALLVRGRRNLTTCCGDPIPDHFPTEAGTLPAGFQEPEE